MAIQRSKTGETVFIFESPEAKKVFLAGDFNEWDPSARRMRKSKDGTFRAKLKLDPGDYSYKFLADDVWLPDPTSEQQHNPFGTTNSIVRVR